MLGASSPRRSISGLLAALVLSFAASSARAELLLFYTFNDDTNPLLAVDDTGNGNDGSIFVATYTDPGMGRTGGAEDRALDFLTPGSGSYLSVDNAVSGAFDSLTANDSATIALWILGSDSQPVNQWTFWFGPGRQLGSHAPWSDGTIYFDVAGCCAGNQRLSKNEPDPARYKSEWNHYAFVKELDFTRIYQNGELWAEGTGKSPLGAITECFFGAGDSGHVSNHSGLFDDIGVWDNALSQEEIQDVMQNGVGPPPDVVIKREIPTAFLPGETITVTLNVEVNNPPITGLEIHERLPLFWVAKNPSAPGTLQTEANGRSVVVWNIAGQIDSQLLTYEITVPDPYANVRWPGSTATVGGKTYGIGGNAVVRGGKDPNVPEALVVTLSTGDAAACGNFDDPGNAFMRRDFMTDGDVNNEQVVAPVQGESIAPDFGGASPATGGTGLNSVVWTRHVAAAGVFNGYNVCDSCMAYVATYVVNPTGGTLKVRIGSATDDSEQILVDGAEVWINNIARGANSASPQDHSAPFDLSPGKHLVLQKVFEGCGGFDSSMRFEDEDRNPLVNLRYTLDPSADKPQAGDPAYTAAGAFVLRTIPASLDVGENGLISLKLRIKTPPIVGGVLEENVPAGFAISDISEGGQRSGQKITWTISGPLEARDLSYRVAVPEGSLDATFAGTATLGGKSAAILGDQGFVRGAMTGTGFIKQWLVLGPLDTFGIWFGDPAFPPLDPNGPSATPENGDIRLDYLRDEDGVVTEKTIRPFDGMRVNTEFDRDGVTNGAKSKALRTLLRACSPAVPTFEKVITTAGTFDNDTYFGEGVDAHTTYAAAYVTNTTPNPITTNLAFNSDDAFIVFLDGAEIGVYEPAPCSSDPVGPGCGRGYGAENTVVEIIPVTIDPGEHFLLTRVHDGGGGSGHRLRFQDDAGNPLLPPAITVSTKSTKTPPAAYARRIVSSDRYRIGGTPITVTIRVETTGPHAVAIREVLPTGFNAANVTDGGNSVGGQITWSLAGVNGTKDVKYDLVPGDCAGAGSWCGNGVDSSEYTVDGGATHALKGDERFSRDTSGNDALGPWDVRDIGTTGGATQRVGDHAADVTGKGAGVRLQKDEFRFISILASGDFSLSTRIDCMDDFSGSGQAGIMVRDTFDTFSAHAFFFLSSTPPAGGGVGTLKGVQRRETNKTKTSAAITITNPADREVLALPVWLRLDRVGARLSLQRSDNGKDYREVATRDIGTGGTTSINLGTDTQIGLAVSGAGGTTRGDYREVSGPPFIAEQPNAPTLTSATPGTKQVTLAWTAPGSGPAPTAYTINRGSSGGPYLKVGEVPATQTVFIDGGLSDSTNYCYVVRAKRGSTESVNSTERCATTPGGPGGGFRRADADANGVVELTDAIFVLNNQFLGGLDPTCMDAADADDSGAYDLTDAIFSLQFQFLGGANPPAPGPFNCGPDPTLADPFTACDYTCQ